MAGDITVVMDFDLDKMLYTIKPEDHTVERITDILSKHPEVKFVSLVGIDIGGHDTDEKIPVKLFIKDMEKLLKYGVQTDGSSVVLPKIANLKNAKVDIIPDCTVNWYVDHNLKHIDRATQLPVGTLRIPSYLLHNDSVEVGGRVVLRDSLKAFEEGLMECLKANPYVFENLGIGSVDEIESLVLTSATELEFWVKSPDEQSDRDKLSTAQELKEQYWKRTIGPVRTALEKTLELLDYYGFEMEMGHKEVGGVTAQLGHAGHYNHIMEQLEIDWKYSTALQAADNENQVKYVVRDVFRLYGLDVSFAAKPVIGIAGSGEHTHLGVAAKLKNGKVVNLFAPKEMREDFMSPIGFGALMGLLKNYDVINPFVSATNDAFNRLKPGYEAPICVVTSLGIDPCTPSRNRTVLMGLVRDMNNPLSTRIELRSPNPMSDTYLVIAASYMAMLDGIKAALGAGKTSKELEASISKECGVEDFYLDTDRMYRTEMNVYEEFTQEERDEKFGKAPRTVWENMKAFEDCKDKLAIFEVGGVMSELILESYKEATIGHWAKELQHRILPYVMDSIRKMEKSHNDQEATDYDNAAWGAVNRMKKQIGKSTLSQPSILFAIEEALEDKKFDVASDMQIKMMEELNKLKEVYELYKKNLL